MITSFDDLPKDLYHKISDYVTPMMYAYGVTQKINGEEGIWCILYIFDECEFYCINIHVSRTLKVFINGFVTQPEKDIDEQINRLVNELEKNGTVSVLKGKATATDTDNTKERTDVRPIDSIDSILSWLPYTILNCLHSPGKSTRSFLNNEIDPEYYKYNPLGISNKKYMELMERPFIYYIVN